MRRFTFGEKVGMVIASLVLVVFLVFKYGFIMIEEGKLGIKMSEKEYLKEPLNPGYHFYLPFISSVTIIPNKPIMLNYSKSEGSRKDTDLLRFETTISTPDKLGNIIDVAISLEMMPIGSMMPVMFAKDGTFEAGFFKKVEQPFKGIVRDVIADFNANTIQSSRAAVKTKLIEKIIVSFNKNEYFKLVNDSVNLKELIPSKKVREMQEKVSLAQQGISIKTKEAKAAEETATGLANAARIAAQGRADAVTIEAEAKAKANNLITKSLTRQLIQYEEVIRWNGVRSKVVAGKSTGLIVDSK